MSKVLSLKKRVRNRLVSKFVFVGQFTITQLKKALRTQMKQFYKWVHLSDANKIATALFTEYQAFIYQYTYLDNKTSITDRAVFAKQYYALSSERNIAEYNHLINK